MDLTSQLLTSQFKSIIGIYWHLDAYVTLYCVHVYVQVCVGCNSCNCFDCFVKHE